MVIDVVESVLGDVTNDQIRALPYFTTLHMADEQLDESRLSGSVWSEDGNTRGERDLECDVVELLPRLSGILEADLAPENN